MPNKLDEGQLALFGAGRVPNLWTRDFRSVGELLADSDFQARQILMDLAVDDVPQLLVAWPDVLFAARDLWAQFPAAVTPGAAQAERRTMELLVRRGNGHRLALKRSSSYLADVPADRRLLEIAKTIRRATTLVRKFGDEVDIAKEPAKSDLAAARARLLHTVYLTAHAVHAATRQLHTEALGDASRPFGLLPGLQGRDFAKVMWILEDWVTRLGAMEAAAGRALGGTYPSKIDGEVAPRGDDSLRLPRALATWELAANRVLCSDPTSADVTMIARTEALIVVAGHRLISANVSGRYREVLENCEASAAGWSRTASWWQLLIPTNGRVSDAVITASAEVRAASRALTLDRTRAADHEAIRAHPAYADAVDALLVSLEEGGSLAERVGDLYSSSLCGPARALARAAHDLEDGASVEKDTVWVSPVDTLANRSIPVPRPVSVAMRSTARSLEVDARELARSASHAGSGSDPALIRALSSAAGASRAAVRRKSPPTTSSAPALGR